MSLEFAKNTEEANRLDVETIFPTADVMAFLNRRRGLIGAVTATSLALACLYVNVAPPVYSSQAEMLVMKKDESITAQGSPGRRDFQGRVAEDLLATHMQLLLSPKIVAQAVERRELGKLPTLSALEAQGGDAVQYIIDNLTIDRGGEGEAKTAHVLTVNLRHSSPDECAAILSAVIESYQDFLGVTFQNVGNEVVSLISTSKAELEVEIQTLENDYKTFREEAPILWKGDQSFNVHQLRLVEIESAISQIRLRRTEIRSRLEMIAEARADMNVRDLSDLERLALIDGTDMARLSMLVSVEQGNSISESFQASQPVRVETASAEFDRMLALKLQEKSLLANFGESHPRVQETRKSIDELNDFLQTNKQQIGTVVDKPEIEADQLLSAYVELLTHDQADLKRREYELIEVSKVESGLAKALVGYELQDLAIQQELARKQQLYNAVLDRLNQINLMADYGGYVTEVISTPQTGEQVAPSLPLSLMLGMCVGLVFGCGIATVVDRADSSFRNPKQIRQLLGLPIMTHLGDLRVKKSGWNRLMKSETPPRIEETVLALHRPKSREAEAIRGLRTSIYFSTRAKNRKILQVTSPGAGDGKTTLTANLAVSLAQSGKRVLLVDCDLRRPRIHRVFGIDNSIGLTDVITNQAELVDATQSCEIENLTILPCGLIPPNPAELLEMPAFERFLAVAREKYDYVLLDTPPVLAVSDPVVIAGHADGVVLAIRLKKNSRSNALRAKEVLATSGVAMLGVVVNGAGSNASYGYSCGSDDFGGYSYGDGKEIGQYYSDEEVASARF